MNAIRFVFDRGGALTFAGDYLDYAGLVAAVVPPGQFATCLALGVFRLGAETVGQVTAEVEGDKTGGTFVWTTADIVRRWLARAADVTDPADRFCRLLKI